MPGKILSLNCQSNTLEDALGSFLKRTTAKEEYDVLLLQEACASTIAHLDDIAHEYQHVVSPKQAEENEIHLLVHNKHAISSIVYEPVCGEHRTTYGALAAELYLNGTEPLVVTSVYLPAGAFPTRPVWRMQGIRGVNDMMRRHFGDASAIVAGDLNTGFPGEYSAAVRILEDASLKNISEHLGDTIDSRYTYFPDRPIISGSLQTLARFNIGFKFKLDHVYASTALLEKRDVSCALLPDRVSDHSGITITLN